MIANFYPLALQRIRDAEARLSVADGDRLHVQFMVCTIYTYRKLIIAKNQLTEDLRVKHGAPATRHRTCPAPNSSPSTTTGTINGTPLFLPARTATSTPLAVTTVAMSSSASGPFPLLTRSSPMTSLVFATDQSRQSGTAISGLPKSRLLSAPTAGSSGPISATGSAAWMSTDGATSRPSPPEPSPRTLLAQEASASAKTATNSHHMYIRRIHKTHFVAERAGLSMLKSGLCTYHTLELTDVAVCLTNHTQCRRCKKKLA